MSSATEPLITIPRQEHRPEDWFNCGARQDLIRLLKEYRDSFGIVRWTVRTIEHFLNIYHYLYPDPFPRQHHTRCIATIICQEGL